MTRARRKSWTPLEESSTRPRGNHRGLEAVKIDKSVWLNSVCDVSDRKQTGFAAGRGSRDVGCASYTIREVSCEGH